MPERILLSLILVLQAVYFIWNMAQMRIPIGQDTFQYFSLQYYFLNNAVFSHQIPLWIPFMTQGTVSSWWYGLQAALLPNALSLIAPLLKSINFVHLFLASFWVDELLLLIGCWLWAKVFFRNPISVFFFTMTVVGTAVWWTQPWYNFHLYYALPLMFYFFHCLIRTGLLRYALVLVSLLVLQLLGNLPYFLPMSTLLLTLYMALWFIFNTQDIPNLIRPGLRWAYVLLVTVILCGIYYYVVTYGTDQIVNYNPGRQLDRTTDLPGFLHFGGGFGLIKWAEMVLGISPNLNYTLYGGVLVLPLLLSGLKFLVDKRVLPVFLFTFLIFDLSMGGMTARVTYYVWPLMKYYRHLGLLSPVLKLCICFLSAFVLDQLLIETGENRKRWLITSFGLLAIVVMAWAVLPFINLSINYMVPERWPEAVIFKKWLMPDLGNRLIFIMTIAFFGAVVSFILARTRSRKLFNIGIFVIIILHMLDICFYKVQETKLRSISAKPYRAQLNFERMPFHTQRQIDARDGRRIDLIKSLPLYHGVEYWSNDPFAFIDEAGSSWRTEHWLKPLDRLMRTYWGQNFDDTTVKPKGLVLYKGLYFPLGYPSARKLSALDRPKLQFFTDILRVPEEGKISRLMVDKQYSGDMPLVLSGPITPGIENKLSMSARLPLPYTLLDFSADELKIKVTSPRSCWLMYSDIWHPQWRASVNGRWVDVSRADLAYKIIPLDQGDNIVHFYFGSWQVRLCQWLLSLFSLAGVVGVFWLLGRIYCQ